MKIAVFTIYAVYASHMGIARPVEPISYNDWIARNSAVSAGERADISADVAAFVNWSKNYPAK